MTMIELRDILTTGTAGTPVTASIGIGELVAIVGASDAETHDFALTLGGAVSPASGTLHGVPEPSLVAWIPRDNQLARTLTALENLTVPLIAHGVRPHEAIERSQSILRDVGLADQEDRLIEELSGGQQQRVAVARGLAQRAQLIVAEDPTSALDAANRRRILALLRDAASDRVVVITASAAESLEGTADVLIDLDSPRVPSI
ncbi:ATP-binding cassette domain-containing protein [Demetria terragena]|uniref:ATP-binding cassette domain-containing protein n=1 Tax=Demetria terragena TaxID=63959 RepID=UPI0003715829|nr:ATP-binding cassette domain-containing protein [Demetria terragena]